ncbi:hypothetical protein [Pantoea agglomerans]|uniref:hypothetical protein n=1 Tax=Enterobacter agglomerans TaxID=549 RepID=UPI003AF2A6DA
MTADDDGKWTFTPDAPLADGEHTLSWLTALTQTATRSATKSALLLMQKVMQVPIPAQTKAHRTGDDRRCG